MTRRLVVFLTIALMVCVWSGIAGAETKKPKITVGTWGIGLTGEVWKERVRQVQARLPNVELELIHMEVGYDDKLISMIATGTAPDVFRVQEPLYRSFRSSGYLMDLSRTIEADPLLSRRMLDVEKNHSQFSGKYYGLTDDWKYITFYYSKDKFAEAGVKAPAVDPAAAMSWDEFINTMKRLTQVDAAGNVKQWGISPEVYRHYELNGWLATFGAPQVFDPEKGRFMADHPDFINTVRLLVAMINEQKIASLHTNLDGWRRLLDGTSASYIGNAERKEALDAANYNYGLGSLPKGPGRAVASTSTWGDYLTVYAKTPYPDEACQVFRELMAETWKLRESRPSYGFYGYAAGGDFTRFIESVIVPYGRPQADPGVPAAWTIFQTSMRKLLRGQAPLTELGEMNRQMNEALAQAK